jgi:hypothetical protein
MTSEFNGNSSFFETAESRLFALIPHGGFL